MRMPRTTSAAWRRPFDWEERCVISGEYMATSARGGISWSGLWRQEAGLKNLCRARRPVLLRILLLFIENTITLRCSIRSDCGWTRYLETNQEYRSHAIFSGSSPG